MTVPDTATAEPTARVGGRWITLLSLANLGLWMAYFGPLQVLLPNQVQQVAGHDKTTVLGIVTGAGALVAVLVGPLAGALSDATTARTGRRHTWIAVGALLGCAGLTLLAAQHTVLGLTLGWCAAQIGLNTLQAGLTAIVPDRAPVRQRGLVSGWIGLTQSIGVVIGVLLVTLVVAGTGGYLLIGVLVVLTAAPFVLATPDPPAAPGTVPRLSARALLGSYRFSLRDNPDFAWAWITRFLVQLGNAMATLYLLYFLRDRVGHPDPDTGLLLLIVVYTAATLLTVVVGGVLSDRTGSAQALGDRVRVRHGRRGRAPRVLADLDRRPDRRGRSGAGLRRLPLRRPGADHPGAPGRAGPGPGPRHHQHRQLGTPGARPRAGLPDRGLPRRLSGALPDGGRRDGARLRPGHADPLGRLTPGRGGPASGRPAR
nr:hypothetical protein GCM10020092_012420 [Actinoplanes digitatis]